MYSVEIRSDRDTQAKKQWHSSKDQNQNMNTKMYVGNLSFDATQEDLESLFSAHGSVKDVFILKDRESGRLRGFAFFYGDTGRDEYCN